MSHPDTYSRTQIFLHWTIAALVIFQLVAHEDMEDDWHDRVRGDEVDLINIHVIVGITILALVIWRIALRLSRGTPPPPAKEPPVLQAVASTTHWAFYALLFIMPFSGMALWFFEVGPAAVVHSIARYLLIALIFLHFAGAMAQHFWFKTNVLKRMLGRA